MNFFLKCTAIKKDLPAALDAPSDTSSEMQEMILANGIADSESLSSMFYGNIIAFLMNSLQSKTVAYKFRVTPVVYYHPEDHKHSDYIILRLINKSAKIVVEVKKEILSDIISANSTHIAQLFHEVVLSQTGRHVIAIYGNYLHSHVFVLDIGTTPHSLMHYCSVPKEKKLFHLEKKKIISLGKEKNYFTDKHTHS